MFKKTAIAAAIVATAIAAPVTTAAATPGFQFGFNTPNGYFSFGTGGGGYYPQPQGLSCWQAKNYLKSQFNHVWTVECNGTFYTFKVKNWGPTKTVKLNSHNGNYWFV